MSNIVHKVKDAVTGHKHHDAPSGSTNVGPHDSNVANKADPRIDSDADNRARHQTAMGTTTTAGPHSSNMGNKADPRVDSDRDHRGAYGSSTTTAPSHGTYNTATGGAYGSTAGGIAPTGDSTNYGPHSSNAANKVDPRVDSDADHRGAFSTTAVGPAPNTAGPHKSDAFNKADPRVDSDLDGSRKVGGDKTFQTTSTGY